MLKFNVNEVAGTFGIDLVVDTSYCYHLHGL